VPLSVVPLTSEYWDHVVKHCVSEIHAGRTPNPDIFCNSRIKFGAFFDYLEAQFPGHFDRIASGHYARLLRADTGDNELQSMSAEANVAAAPARNHNSLQAKAMAGSSSSREAHVVTSPRVYSTEAQRMVSQVGDANVLESVSTETLAEAIHTPNSQKQVRGMQHLSTTSVDVPEKCSSFSSHRPVQLCLTADAVKDQTYFLAHLTQQQLSRVMFPLAPLTKAETRHLARHLNLPTQQRKDSQGLCFLGKVKFNEFIKVCHACLTCVCGKKMLKFPCCFC
jgi:hypothetical protein